MFHGLMQKSAQTVNVIGCDMVRWNTASESFWDTSTKESSRNMVVEYDISISVYSINHYWCDSHIKIHALCSTGVQTNRSTRIYCKHE